MIKPFKHQWTRCNNLFPTWTCSKCGLVRKRFADKPVYYYLVDKGWTTNRPDCKLNTEK